MYPVTFAEIEMGSVIIGVALIALVAIIVLACIFRLDSKTMLEVFKFLGPIIGLIVGTMGTHFFTRGEIAQKNRQLEVVQAALKTSERQKLQAADKIQSLLPDISSVASSQRQE